MSDIESLRNRIDEITIQMLKLFKERIDAARQIGEIKKNNGLSVFDEKREEQIRVEVTELCKKSI